METIRMTTNHTLEYVLKFCAVSNDGGEFKPFDPFQDTTPCFMRE